MNNIIIIKVLKKNADIYNIRLNGVQAVSNFFYNRYSSEQQTVLDNNDKASDLTNRVEQFKEVSSLKDAFLLADKIMPTTNELTKFNSGDAECTVVRKSNQLRITLETKSDFICYDFS